MKPHWLFLFGLILTFGLGACSSTASPARIPEDTPTQTIHASPTSTTEVPATSTPTSTSVPATATATTPPTPTPFKCREDKGSIETHQIESNHLSDPLVYRIYLPPCHGQEKARQYNTLYLFHGQTFTEDQWDRLGIDEVADKLISLEIISPLIIIMPQEQDQRTPPPENLYGEAIIEDLIPHIDQTYQGLGQREHRAIGGLSRGGNWAVHLGLMYWEYFSSIGAHSTPSFVTDGPPRIRELLAAIPQDQLPRIYMDTGDDDGWREYTFRLETVFTEENIPHEWHLFQGAHDEEYWAKHVEVYLRWYALNW